MPARSRELKLGIGFKKQTGTGADATTPTQLQTALSAGDLWSLGQSSFSPAFPDFVKETNALFYGKGHEWITQTFKTSLAVRWAWQHFLTSQNFAQVLAFALGVKSETTAGTGAYRYIMTPMDPIVDGVNLPATTVVAGIRQGGAGEILDVALVGLVCNSFNLRLQRGPGLQNTQLNSEWVGCGKYVNNSGISIPSATTESRLGAGSGTALTINGVNYLTNARFVDMELAYNNNVKDGYFPGSGQQSGFDVQGRMRYGNREISLTCLVELESDSAELAALVAGTEGAAIFTLEGDTITGGIKHTAEVQFPLTEIKAYKLEEADDFTAARIEIAVKFNEGTDAPMIARAITDKTGIGTAA